MSLHIKKIISYLCLTVAVPIIVIGGAILFSGKHYAWISLCVAVLVCIPPLCFFEKKDITSKETAVLAVMVALSAAGRFVFAWFPGFKQMMSWGLIGFLAGVFSSQLKKSKAALCIFGVGAGVMFSLLMDIWTVLWADVVFNLSRYSAAVISALPVTAEYAISNVIFLLIMAKPIGEKLERIKKKYGLFAAV